MLDLIINLSLAILLIVGGYQFYFLPQNHSFVIPRTFNESFIDRIIPFKPEWIWIYSGLYYPMIVFLVFSIRSFEEFSYIAFSFTFLLITQLMFFFLLPVKTPDSWRSYNERKNLSTKFMAFVHNYDQSTNCFPSMHVSVATLTSFHLIHIHGTNSDFFFYLILLYPLLISLSTLFTKQHYFFDIPAGGILGWLNFEFFISVVT